MSNILLMGPIPPAYTGQSVAFNTVVEFYRKQQNIRLFEVNLSNKNGILKGLLLCLYISKLCLTKKIDLIYFTCSRSFLGSIRDLVLLFWAKIFGIKVVNHLHGGDFANFYSASSFLYKKLLKCLYSRVDTSIVLLDDMKSQFVDFPKMKLSVIANSYDNLLDNYPTKRNQNDNTLRFLYLSNIMKSKGILNLLDAFSSILKKNNEFKLIIAGDFIADYLMSKNEIKQEFFLKYNFLKKKYPDRIDYIGVTSGKNKNDLLWNSDVFILPTYHKTEAFPISLLEALRTGNYIISTNHNYIPQIISSENGLMVSPDSVIELEKALMHTIYMDRSILNEIQNKNIQYAESSFKEDIYVNSVKNVIDETLANNRNVQ